MKIRNKGGKYRHKERKREVKKEVKSTQKVGGQKMKPFIKSKYLQLTTKSVKSVMYVSERRIMHAGWMLKETGQL